MPILLVVLGLMLLASGYNHKAKDLIWQLEDDAKAFGAFALVILIVGFAGLNKTIRPVSNMFLGLVFVVFFLRNGKNIVSGIEDTIKNVPSGSQSSADGSSDSAASQSEDLSQYAQTGYDIYNASTSGADSSAGQTTSQDVTYT